MMGRSHSLSGTTAWASLACAAPLVGVRPHWQAVAIGLLATSGAALLPDVDHPSASIANTFGPASKAVATFVNRVSGGHRHATHSLAFAAAGFLGTWAGVSFGGRWFALAVLFVLFAFGIRALHLAPGIGDVVALAATVAAAAILKTDFGWLPWSVGVGILAHLTGDCLTKEGCPLLWPRRRHYMLPVVRRTGNAVERWVFAPLFMLGTVVLLAFGR
jgi:membrane-bound metal-dependent hydrolase YbcI (DUF457 family)